MTSDDVLLCARRLEYAWRSGRALPPGECRALARVLNVAALDVAAFEDVPLAPGQVQTAPDAACPVVYARCVTPPPPPVSTAQILPFRPPRDG